jgi:hypothetical protein
MAAAAVLPARLPPWRSLASLIPRKPLLLHILVLLSTAEIENSRLDKHTSYHVQ